jgi:hypothetical protein
MSRNKLPFHGVTIVPLAANGETSVIQGKVYYAGTTVYVLLDNGNVATTDRSTFHLSTGTPWRKRTVLAEIAKALHALLPGVVDASLAAQYKFFRDEEERQRSYDMLLHDAKLLGVKIGKMPKVKPPKAEHKLKGKRKYPKKTRPTITHRMVGGKAVKVKHKTTGKSKRHKPEGKSGDRRDD